MCFLSDTTPTEIYTLSLHDALPIYVFTSKDETALTYLPGVIVGIFAFRGLMNFGQSYFNDYVGLRIINDRSEEHTSELQSRLHLVCRLLLEKKKETGMTSTDKLR